MSSYAIRNDYEDEESMRGRPPVWMVVVTGGSGAAPAHRALSARSRDAREQRVQGDAHSYCAPVSKPAYLSHSAYSSPIPLPVTHQALFNATSTAHSY